MIKTPISLQDLREKIYLKAKAEQQWRFWGLYVHICKRETIKQAYFMAKKNNGAPGIDRITFNEIEKQGYEIFVEQIRYELISGTYRPMRNRKKKIPKDDKRFRTLSIPTIKDRVVQGTLKLILEPIFEADFQTGSFGYRPNKTPHQAIARVRNAITKNKTQVIDLDLKAYFDNVRHYILLKKIARRVEDNKIMRLLKLTLKASGKRGVPQGGVISPVLSNIYLNDMDTTLEEIKRTYLPQGYKPIEYARFADDMVILIEDKNEHLLKTVFTKIIQIFQRLKVQINKEKTKIVNAKKGETFGFLGFNFKKVKTKLKKTRTWIIPKIKARKALTQRLKQAFHKYRTLPLQKTIELINPIIRGWVNYFRVGNSSRCFEFIKHWIEKKIRKKLMKARNCHGFGWNRWSREWIYETMGLYNDYKIEYFTPQKCCQPISIITL